MAESRKIWGKRGLCTASFVAGTKIIWKTQEDFVQISEIKSVR